MPKKKNDTVSEEDIQTSIEEEYLHEELFNNGMIFDDSNEENDDLNSDNIISTNDHNNQNIEIVNNMFNNAGVNQQVDEDEEVEEEMNLENANQVPVTSQDMFKLAADLRSSLRSILGAKDFTSLSYKEIEYLDSKGITNTFDLINTQSENDEIITNAKANLLGKKHISNKDIAKIANTFYEAEKTHSSRPLSCQDSLSYQDEARAVLEAQYFLRKSGFNDYTIKTIANPPSQDALDNAMYVASELTKYCSKIRENNDLELPNKSLKNLKSLLGMREIRELSQEQLEAINAEKRGLKDIDQNVLTEAKEILNGMDFIQETTLDNVIEHLANQEDILSKINPSDDLRIALEKSIQTQKDIILNKGIPNDSLNKMIMYKQIEHLKKQMDILDKKDAQSQDYSNLKQAVNIQKSLIIMKGITEEELSNSLQNDGKDGLRREYNEHNCNVLALTMVREDYWKNIDAFYGRLAHAFDAENFPVGKDLSTDNLTEALKVYKEMQNYSRQLGIKGKISESANVQEHVNKISKFLVIKGVPKDKIREINKMYTADAEVKSKEIINAIHPQQELVQENQVIENNQIQQIEVDLGDNINNNDYDMIEQFDDVQQVRTNNNDIQINNQSSQEQIINDNEAVQI